MNSKQEVKQLLKDSGHPELFTEENYRIATVLTHEAEKRDPMLRQHFKNAEGFREIYKRDLIIHNKLKKNDKEEIPSKEDSKESNFK